MSLLDKIIGNNIADPVTAVGNVVDALFTSDEERLDKKAVLEKLRQQPQMVQTEINKLEAQHRSIFVAGWRPLIGWVCGAGLFNVFLVNPWLQWYTGYPGPELPLESMTTLVISLLGLAGYRTFEKVSGKSK